MKKIIKTDSDIKNQIQFALSMYLVAEENLIAVALDLGLSVEDILSLSACSIDESAEGIVEGFIDKTLKQKIGA